MNKNYRAVLQILASNRGEIAGASLSGSQKRLATRLEVMGLVRWSKPTSTAPRASSTLRITVRGIKALAADVET